MQKVKDTRLLAAIANSRLVVDDHNRQNVIEAMMSVACEVSHVVCGEPSESAPQLASRWGSDILILSKPANIVCVSYVDPLEVYMFFQADQVVMRHSMDHTAKPAAVLTYQQAVLYLVWHLMQYVSRALCLSVFKPAEDNAGQEGIKAVYEILALTYPAE